MDIWIAKKDTSWIAVSTRHIGYCYQEQGDLETALNYFMMSYLHNTSKGSQRNLMTISGYVGRLYLEKGDYDLAERWCSQSLEMADTLDDLIGKRGGYECLSNLYELIGDPVRSLKNYKAFINLRDSISGNERIKELTRLEMGFNFQRQQLADSLQFEKQVEVREERIQRQNVGLISTGLVLLMILILALAIYKGKKRSDQLLLNILPEEIAEELKETGSAKARKFENVSVLFTDFKGFTSIAETLTPEELVAEVNQCFSAFDTIMGTYGIEKIKTIGDSYMAASGLPNPNADHAVLLVKAAKEIQSFMEDLKEERDKQGKPTFEVRIGINSGPLVAGIVGTKKFQYDIWGDTVNTASRLESKGEIGKVNISESTYLLVKDQFNCTYRGEVEAKGKGKVKMYFVEEAV